MNDLLLLLLCRLFKTSRICPISQPVWTAIWEFLDTSTTYAEPVELWSLNSKYMVCFSVHYIIYKLCIHTCLLYKNHWTDSLCRLFRFLSRFPKNQQKTLTLITTMKTCGAKINSTINLHFTYQALIYLAEIATYILCMYWDWQSPNSLFTYIYH